MENETMITLTEEYAPNLEITGAYDEALAAKCENGTFVGFLKEDVKTWKGIPFAAQPVGNLRFKKAIDPEPSDKVFEAVHCGPSCLQFITIDECSSTFEQREECLTLNIWANKNSTVENKPVAVFIHGGAWIQGGLCDPIYDGHDFVQNNPDVILVCITYRLGMMGIINLSEFPDGDEYKEAGNNALLDQVQALRWIKKNIAAFGGNPENITILGESAGAGAVSLLCIQPEAKGLFQKAMPMSGGCNQCFGPEKAHTLTEKLKEELGCTTVKDLVDLPFETLKEFWHTYGFDIENLPLLDEVVIPQDPFALWENGATKDLIVMQGHTSNEFRYFQDVYYGMEDMYEAYCVCAVDQVKAESTAEENAIIDRYYDVLRSYGITGKDLVYGYMNDITLSAPNKYQAYHHAANNGKGYFYIFDKAADANDYLGACHAMDLFYFFGYFDGHYALGTPEEVELCRWYQKMIVNFCTYGDPSTEEAPWPMFDNETRMTMIIDDNPHVVENPQPKRFEILIEMMKDIALCRYTNPLSYPMPEIEKRYPEVYNKYMTLVMEDCQG